jgi:MFS family permease
VLCYPASLGFISVLAGCLTSGPLLDTLGRKKTLLVINTPFIIGWLLMWMAPKPAPVSLLYFARLLNGLGQGMVRSGFLISTVRFLSVIFVKLLVSCEPPDLTLQLFYRFS